MGVVCGVWVWWVQGMVCGYSVQVWWVQVSGEVWGWSHLGVANLIVPESLAGWHRHPQLPVCLSIQLVSADKTGTFGM